MCCLEDMKLSFRSDLQYRNSSSSQTTDYKKRRGGTIRFLPALACETVTLYVFLPMEEAERLYDRRIAKAQFTLGRLSVSRAESRISG